MTNSKKDIELEELIAKKISSNPNKLVVVGTGITSSHLGDERNIREFIVANSVVNKLRDENKNTLFYLFDDSFDPLNFRQLRVAVKKDEKLIEKFSKYCGMPLKLIPDPYECHQNYSSHYQNEILDRFHSLDIYPNIIDAYSSYESGLYDHAKKIVFSKYNDIKEFLKKSFPKYNMKKIFCPLCPKCFKMEEVDVRRVVRGRVTIECANCKNRYTDSWKNIKGKFSWKIDTAVRWNVFGVDFEPYSKAYLDPDVGSYYIAKKLSERFFGGYHPEIVSYGQIIMDKSLSYKLLSSFPKEALHSFLLGNRKQDLVLTEKKILQFSRNYLVDDTMSFYDYIVTRLPYDLYEVMQGNKVHPSYKKFMDSGTVFARSFLKRELNPGLPRKELLREMTKLTRSKISKLFQWVILYKMENNNISHKIFSEEINQYLENNKIRKSILFPQIRKLMSQEESLPISKIFYHAPLTYLYGCLLTITKVITDMKTEQKAGKYNKKKNYESVS